jgi:hypothetical protein
MITGPLLAAELVLLIVPKKEKKWGWIVARES